MLGAQGLMLHPDRDMAPPLATAPELAGNTRTSCWLSKGTRIFLMAGFLFPAPTEPRRREVIPQNHYIVVKLACDLDYGDAVMAV